jgi:ABC-type maltose transport system permease subunit
MSAFAFSRFRWAGRSQLLLVILLIQVFPAILAMVALFAILQQIGNYIPFLGLNTHGGLILIYMGGALGVNVWLMKGFFDSIPRDIDESGRRTGRSSGGCCSRWCGRSWSYQ